MSDVETTSAVINPYDLQRMALSYDCQRSVLRTAVLRLLLSLDIYFHQNNAAAHHAALELRDSVLRLRRDGAFVAVPLFRVNTEPMGPHPIGVF